MHAFKTYQTDSSGPQATEELGHTLGSKLRGGEVIVLLSDLGGGKTAFVRGVAAGMGSPDHVASPTFTLTREYHSDNLTLYHFDFYRLSEPGIVAAELAEFIHDSKAVVAIEWGEIVAGVLPDKKLTVQIERIGDEMRRLTFSCPESLAYLIPDSSMGCQKEEKKA